jgi:hypothetical protein
MQWSRALDAKKGRWSPLNQKPAVAAHYAGALPLSLIHNKVDRFQRLKWAVGACSAAANDLILPNLVKVTKQTFQDK